MGISITDVRKKRKVAMQKIRRAYKKLGMSFTATPEKFATPKKGMTQEELNRLYSKYENIMQGNFMLNIGDGRYMDFATGEIIEPEPEEYEEYGEEEEVIDEDYTPTGSHVQHAFDLVASLNYPNATNHFRYVLDDAINEFGLSAVDVWFRDNTEYFAELYKELVYSIQKNDDSTSYFVDIAISEFESVLMGSVS